MKAALDHELPFLSNRIDIEGTPYVWEMFSHAPHEEGWCVLCWECFPKGDRSCVDHYEFGEDLLLAALIKFIEMHKTAPRKTS